MEKRNICRDIGVVT